MEITPCILENGPPLHEVAIVAAGTTGRVLWMYLCTLGHLGHGAGDGALGAVRILELGGALVRTSNSLMGLFSLHTAQILWRRVLATQSVHLRPRPFFQAFLENASRGLSTRHELHLRTSSQSLPSSASPWPPCGIASDMVAVMQTCCVQPTANRQSMRFLSIDRVMSALIANVARGYAVSTTTQADRGVTAT